MKNNYAIIMAGGIGSRFWPMSTPEKPKQFLDVLGIGKSLIQMTYERLRKIVPSSNIYIVTNEGYKTLVLNQLPELKQEQVLTEPVRKNTAPCIAYAAAKIHSVNPDARLLISPADHLILQEGNFEASINAALTAADQGRIATIGIKPSRPDTGYGYIEFHQNANTAPNNILPVVQFREKPDLTTAKTFVESGNFYWNAGIFIWKTSTVLNALKVYQPDLYALFCGDLSWYNTESEEENKNKAFHNCADISIDYAVMEYADNIDVVLASFDWSDLGTWGSLVDHLKKDHADNAVIGQNVNLFHSSNCIVNIENDHTAIIDGLEDYIVIQSENRLLIIRKENEQELKNFLKRTEK